MNYFLKVDITKEDVNRLWRGDWLKICRNILQKTYQELTLERPAKAEIAVLLTNNNTMRQYNFQYCNIDKPTNVLSFPADFSRQPHQAKFLGNIALGYEIIEQESLAHHLSFSAHFHHLCIHGLLHILGYDHINDNDAEIMEQEEIRLLHTLFNIPNPYVHYV